MAPVPPGRLPGRICVACMKCRRMPLKSPPRRRDFFCPAQKTERAAERASVPLEFAHAFFRAVTLRKARLCAAGVCSRFFQGGNSTESTPLCRRSQPMGGHGARGTDQYVRAPAESAMVLILLWRFRKVRPCARGVCLRRAKRTRFRVSTPARPRRLLLGKEVRKFPQ